MFLFASRVSIVCLSLLCLFLASSSAYPREIETLKIGESAPDFSLPGVDGKIHRLSDFDAAKVLVVIFTCNHCPTAQAYEHRIKQLHQDYRQRNVALVAISPNDPKAVRLDELGYTDVSDSLEDMKIRARDRDFQFPYLYDGETQEVSAAYGVRATPHVFIFDEAQTLRYVGRIDDSDIKKVESHDARNAINALLAGKPVPVAKTRVFGCSTKWSDKRASAREATKRWNQEPVNLERISEEQLQTLVRNDTEKYRLVNLWATWCVPCIVELPKLVTINRMYRRRPFELVTISADVVEKQDNALGVLRDNHVSAKNYLFDSDDRDALHRIVDDKSEGGLPYTVLIAPGGEIVYRHHGEIDSLELKKAIVNRLGRTYASR